MLCFALFACAFNLLLGFAGLLSFGHAAFFGAAAYVCAWLSKAWGVTPELAILSGGAVAGGRVAGEGEPDQWQQGGAARALRWRPRRSPRRR